MAPKAVRRTVAGRSRTRAKAAGPVPAGRLESILARQGYRLVAGVDEVGRGALAGPLVAASVLLDVDRIPKGVCDSKMLTALQRERCAAEVLSAAVAVSWTVVDAEDIDGDGLHVSNLAAMVRAVRALRPAPDYVISDGFALDDQGFPHIGLPRADALSAAVAGASVVAKVSRDSFMRVLDTQYPGYGFSRHKGYGTAEHWTAIRALGPSAVHRRSFKGVASYQPSFEDL
ncbi:MAG TPA: ribonuclease HII [Actinomycetota bacterium]|nr:ribonuclease HII [Actinomycetota bacterium]